MYTILFVCVQMKNKDGSFKFDAVKNKILVLLQIIGTAYLIDVMPNISNVY